MMIAVGVLSKTFEKIPIVGTLSNWFRAATAGVMKIRVTGDTQHPRFSVVPFSADRIGGWLGMRRRLPIRRLSLPPPNPPDASPTSTPAPTPTPAAENSDSILQKLKGGFGIW